MNGICCNSTAVTGHLEVTTQGCRRFRCRNRDKRFNERGDGAPNRIFRPSDIIAFVVPCRRRYRLAGGMSFFAKESTP
ncbi:MAG: hypothetical protein ACRYHQ_35985 [Janthinobacterium lividum]